MSMGARSTWPTTCAWACSLQRSRSDDGIGVREAGCEQACRRHRPGYRLLPRQRRGAGDGGLLVLESYEHAVARGARIHAELVGYGVTSDGVDMVAPSGEGAVRCMRMALEGVDAPIDYLNTHGTSTPLGDMVELESVREAFAGKIPPLSSPKALSGHSLGAARVHEASYCLLMLQHGFMAGSANIEQLDPKAEGFPILRESRDAGLRTVMS